MSTWLQNFVRRSSARVIGSSCSVLDSSSSASSELEDDSVHWRRGAASSMSRSQTKWCPSWSDIQHDVFAIRTTYSFSSCCSLEGGGLQTNVTEEVTRRWSVHARTNSGDVILRRADDDRPLTRAAVSARLSHKVSCKNVVQSQPSKQNSLLDLQRAQHTTGHFVAAGERSPLPWDGKWMFLPPRPTHSVDACPIRARRGNASAWGVSAPLRKTTSDAGPPRSPRGVGPSDLEATRLSLVGNKIRHRSRYQRQRQSDRQRTDS